MTDGGSGTTANGSERKYELWRDAVYFDDEPVHLDTFDSRDEAEEELVRKAEFADLLHSDYEIRKVDTHTEQSKGGDER